MVKTNKIDDKKVTPKYTKKNSTQKDDNIKIPINNSLSLEIISICIICLSILLIISIFFGGGGFLGKFLSNFLKGFFGIGAYILPIILLVSSVTIFFLQSRKINIFKLVISVLSFIFLISLFHIISNESSYGFSNYFTYLSSQYKSGRFIDGGMVGAIFGDLFLKVMGTIASYIVLIILLIACICLLTGKSFFTTIYKGTQNISNLFYYKYDVEEEYEEDMTTYKEDKMNTFYTLKNQISKFIQNRNRYDKYEYEEEHFEEEQPIRTRNFIDFRSPKYSSSSTAYSSPTTRVYKKYNNYIFDGTDRYRKIQKPVFFDMPVNNIEKKDKKLIFAIDEINNPEKYNTKNNILNNVQETVKEEYKNEKYNEYVHQTTSNFVKEYEIKQDVSESDVPQETDLFNIKTQEQYINEMYKSKKDPLLKEGILQFDVDLESPNKRDISDIFDNPPEKFLSENQDLKSLEKLNNFYNFDKGLEQTLENNTIEDDLLEDNFSYEEELINNDLENDFLEEDFTEHELINEDLIKDNFELTDDDLIDDRDFENISDIEDCPPWIESIDNLDEKVLQSSIPPKNNNVDKDGYTIIRQNAYNIKNTNENIDEIPNENQISQNLDNSIPEPVIIRAEKEKMVTSLQAEKENIKKEYIFPKLEFLSQNPNIQDDDNDIELRENSTVLVKTLKSFNVSAQVINISKGPSVTRYELSIEDGIKVSKILGLADNLALSLAATSIRIEAPIPGKSAVGIEIPNKEIKSVFLSEVICSEKFQKFPSRVSFGIGKDITGNVIVTDIAKMPHMLIAGATGSGKSVCINTLITSILYKANPEEVKLMMIDPKVVELSVYNGIPHLLTPVVTEPEKAAGVLNWAVSEMMVRYNLFAETGTRNLTGYNEIKEENSEPKLPQIVIIIDELADLMMVAAKEVEASICRLAQLARAAGIHLIIATQRPSVDVITGLIKANIPSRIAFAVSSGTDSRTVLDTVGAEKLLGKGDMLFKSVDMSKPLRIQGAFISDREVENIVTFIKENGETNYDQSIINKIEGSVKTKDDKEPTEYSDELIEDIIGFLVRKGKASTSMIQRQFRIGYNRAARIIEELEDRGIVSSENGSKPRDVLMDKYQYEEYQNRYDSY